MDTQGNDDKKEIIHSKATSDLARFSSNALVKWGLDFPKVLQKQNLVNVLRSIWGYCKEAITIETFSYDQGNWNILDDFCASREIRINDVIHMDEIPVRERIAEFLIKSARLLVALGDAEGLQDNIEIIANSEEFCGRTRMQAAFVLALIGRREWASKKIFQIMKDDEGTGYGKEFDEYLLSVEPLPDNPYLLWETFFCDLRFEYWDKFIDTLGSIGYCTDDLFYNVRELLDNDIFGTNTHAWQYLSDIWQFFFKKKKKESTVVNNGLHDDCSIIYRGNVSSPKGYASKLFTGMHVEDVPSDLLDVVSRHCDIADLEQKTLDTLVAYAQSSLREQLEDDDLSIFHRQLVCALFLCRLSANRYEGIEKISDLSFVFNGVNIPEEIFECVSALGYDSFVVDSLINTVKKDLGIDIKLLLCLEITTMLLGEKND